MKRGAYDYITKPFALDRLELVTKKPTSGCGSRGRTAS